MNKTEYYAIGYRRLSYRDQSKYSLEFQEEAIKIYCRKNGLKLIALFTDNGECSDTFDRPDYKALEAFIKKHKNKVRYLIVMSHDRFSRSLGEALIKINELQEKFYLKVLATNEDINIDVHDPYVFMQRAFAYLMANQELLQIRKRTRDSIRHAQLSGRYVSNAPFGYINKRDDNNKGILSIDDAKAEVIRKIFRWYLAGSTIKEIKEKAKQSGFKNAGHSAIQRVLSNPVYASLIRIAATEKTSEYYVKAIHQPIVTELDFYQAKEKLSNKKPVKSQPKETYPLRGIIKCECGKNMTAGYSKGKKKYYLYYRCTEHHGISYRGDKLHQQFEDLLGSIVIDKAQIAIIKQRAFALLEESVQNQREIIASRNKQLAEIERKSDKLDDLLLNGEIDGLTFNRLYLKLSEDKEILISSRQESLNEAAKWDDLGSFFNRLVSLKDIYHIATLSAKHSLIRKIFHPSLIYSNGVFKVKLIVTAFADRTSLP